MAAARVVTVNGVKYALPKGTARKIALEKLMTMLPASGQTEAAWVSDTRIEAASWKQTLVYSQCIDLRVRSAFVVNGDLVWTETCGPSVNATVDKIKTPSAKRRFLLNEFKKFEKYSPKAKPSKDTLKPVIKTCSKFVRFFFPFFLETMG